LHKADQLGNLGTGSQISYCCVWCSLYSTRWPGWVENKDGHNVGLV